MTYNIQSGRNFAGELNLAFAEEAIRALAPDICALNEVRMKTRDVGDSEQARELGERLGMEWRFARAIPYNGGDYGIGLLSRWPLGEMEVWPVPPLPEGERDARYEDRVIFRCPVRASEGEIAVYGAHFGLSQGERENAVGLAERLLGAEMGPALFMGDLNMTPDDPLVARLEAAIPNAAPGAPFFTWKSDAPSQKIDYIFASRHFRVTRTWVERTLASDHLPHLAEVEWSPSRS